MRKFLCFLSLLIISVSLQVQNVNAQNINPLKGNSFPAINVTSLTDKTYSNESLKGKVILVNCWFIGCEPCMQESKYLNRLRAEIKDTNFVILAFAPYSKITLSHFQDSVPYERIGKLRKELGVNLFNYEIIPACTHDDYKKWSKKKNITLDFGCDDIEKRFFVSGYPTNFFSISSQPKSNLIFFFLLHFL